MLNSSEIPDLIAEGWSCNTDTSNEGVATPCHLRQRWHFLLAQQGWGWDPHLTSKAGVVSPMAMEITENHLKIIEYLRTKHPNSKGSLWTSMNSDGNHRKSRTCVEFIGDPQSHFQWGGGECGNPVPLNAEVAFPPRSMDLYLTLRAGVAYHNEEVAAPCHLRRWHSLFP